MKIKILKEKIIASLEDQGFYVNGHLSPLLSDKNSFKAIHDNSRVEQIQLSKNFIEKNFAVVQKYVAKKINPANITLELREVKVGTIEETIYRWWNLTWWSVPYQKAYGRQMRFLIWDTAHDAPFGLIGLQSPILKMAVRDKFLEIPKAELDYVINKSMQAQRLGALPGYYAEFGQIVTA